MGRRRGMTLPELLVAMVILLVGIYAVATGFPALFGNLESERIRTEMARRLEGRMEGLKTAAYAIPEAVTGHDPLDLPVIPPDVYPDETQEPIPGNPRDDLTWDIGETFRDPIALAGQTYSVHPLSMGPAGIQDMTAIGDYLQVTALVPLQRTEVGMPLGPDQFYVDEDGYLHAPTVFASAEVDYVWVDADGQRHGVLGEVVENLDVNVAANPVRAAAVAGPPAFINVLPDQTRATGLVPFTSAVGQPADVAPGYAVLESTYGATLLLSPVDANSTLRVTYQLMTEPDTKGSERRVTFMTEEMSAPTQPPYQVDLAVRGINDEVPLFTEDVTGATLAEPVYVLIVDLFTGETWADAEDWVGLDFIEGRLTLDWTHASAPMDPVAVRGHDLRVFYRTIAGHTIVVEKAPSWFVEDYIYDTYVAEGLTDRVDYRYYQVDPDPNAAAYTQLTFPMSAAQQMVVVDYMVDADPADTVPPRRVSGELHVVPVDTLSFTLNEPDVRGILAVRGVSLTVRGWWRGDSGRVETVSINSFLTPEPLL